MTDAPVRRRLVAEGAWRAAPEARRRDVVVHLGDASLVLVDRGERALAHWSLAALERRGDGVPACYAPGADAGEEVEIADAEMVAALDRIVATTRAAQARPGALRAGLLGAGLAAVVGLAVLWLPDALISHAARVVPPSARATIGGDLLTHVFGLTGRPCAGAGAALDALALRLGGATGTLVLVPGGAVEALHVPGGTIVLRRTLVEDHETADVAAGYILAETTARRGADPLMALLENAGALAALRLLTTGRITDATLAAEAERLATGGGTAPPRPALIAAFAAADVSTAPYARARDVTGETTLWLIEADPAPGGGRPVLPDGAWVALQGACDG